MAPGAGKVPPHPLVIDISSKAETAREAIARAKLVITSAAPLSSWWPTADAAAEAALTTTASVAGVGAAKRTAGLIPMCHALALDFCSVSVSRPGLDGKGWSVAVEARARTLARTGVEMEALVGASVAALTLYDMLKGKVGGPGSMHVERVELVSKTGGASSSK
jgi:cyclic pyranopterin phosphate synthase